MKKLLLIALLFISVNLHAQQPPTACFTGDSAMGPCKIDFTDLSLGNPTAWSWTFTGGVPASYSGIIPPFITYSTPGTYDVSLTVTNAVGNDTETKVGVVVITSLTCFYDTSIYTPCILATGINDKARVDQLVNIYPNPASSSFTIGGNFELPIVLMLYNIIGEQVRSEQVSKPDAAIDVSSLTEGIYVWQLGDARGKLIKE